MRHALAGSQPRLHRQLGFRVIAKVGFDRVGVKFFLLNRGALALALLLQPAAVGVAASKVDEAGDVPAEPASAPTRAPGPPTERRMARHLAALREQMHAFPDAPANST